jgi:CubicO group peptidase (beta-lactamase class C family)
MRNIFLQLLLLITLITPSVAQLFEIKAGTLVEANLDARKIEILLDSIRSGFYPNRHSLLVYKNNKLVIEEYFRGDDSQWGKPLGVINHTDTTLHDVRSVSKSIVSACIGLCIAQGKIKSVEQKVFDFFPEYARFRNEGREQLTIKHFLTMTSGLEWNEEVPYDNPENSEIQMDHSPDPVAFVLSRKMIAKPGTSWRYNGGTTEVLAEIIKKTTGKDVYAFAQQYLFKPLGIVKSYWTSIPGTNRPAAASGLRLTSRDLLKFAILYKNNGMWNNQQLLPANWINDSFTSQVARPQNGGYGYQFWIFTWTSATNKQFTWPAAVGNGDQRIFFDVANDLVVVMTAGNYNKWDIKNDSFAIMRAIMEAHTK